VDVSGPGAGGRGGDGAAAAIAGMVLPDVAEEVSLGRRFAALKQR